MSYSIRDATVADAEAIALVWWRATGAADVELLDDCLNRIAHGNLTVLRILEEEFHTTDMVELGETRRKSALDARATASPISNIADFREMLEYDSAIVAVNPNGVIGFCMWGMAQYAHVTHAAVDPEYGRCGVGTELVQTVMRATRASGFKRLTADVTTAGRALTVSLGFHPDGAGSFLRQMAYDLGS